MYRKTLLAVALSALCSLARGDTGFGSTIRVTETDNSPACTVGLIKVTTGTLTCNGQTATLLTGGGGGGSSGGVTTLPLPGGATNYIQNTGTLQSGATFYVSSGTVTNQLIAGAGLQTPIPFVAYGGKSGSQSNVLEIRNIGTSGAGTGTESRIYFSEGSSGQSENGAIGFTDRDGTLGGSMRVYLTPNGTPANEAEILALNYNGNYGKMGLNVDSPAALLDVEGSLTTPIDSTPVLKLFSNNNQGRGDVIDAYGHTGSLNMSLADNGAAVLNGSMTITGANGLNVTYGLSVGSMTGAGLANCANDGTHALVWSNTTSQFSCVSITATGGSSTSTVVAGTGLSQSISGSTITLSLSPASTFYIQNTSSLQSGSTFYVSSGTVAGVFTSQQEIDVNGSGNGELDLSGTGNGQLLLLQSGTTYYATSSSAPASNVNGQCAVWSGTTTLISVPCSSGGAGTPGGSSGQIQYNNGGSFGGALSSVTSSSITILSSTSFSSNGLQNSAGGSSFVDVFHGSAIPGQQLFGVGSQTQNNQFYVPNALPVYMGEYGAHIGQLQVGYAATPQQIVSQSRNNFIEVQNGSTMTFNTDNDISGGDILFQPQNTEAFRVSALTGISAKTPKGMSVTYGVSVGSMTGAGLTSCSSASSAVTWNSSTSQFGCNTISGSGGGGSGTVNAAAQFSAPYYSLAGTTTTISGFAPVTFSTVSATGVAITTPTIITSTGTTNALRIKANGLYGTTNGTSGGLSVDCTGGGPASGMCAQFYTNAGAQTALAGLVNVVNDSNTWNEPMLYFQDASSANGHPQIRIDGLNVNVEAINTNLGGTVKYEPFAIPAAGDYLQVNGRDAANSTFKDIARWHRFGGNTATGGALGFNALQMMTTGQILWNDSTDSHYVGFRGANTIPANVAWTLPTGDNVGAMQSDGSGNLNFSKVSLSSGVIGTIQASNFPALTGDVTTSAGSLATTAATLQGNISTLSASSITVSGPMGLRVPSGPITASSAQFVTSGIFSVQATSNVIMNGTTQYSGGYIVTGSTMNATNYMGGGLANCGDTSHATGWNSTTGLFTCQSITGSAGSPGGVIGNVQYNNPAGTFAGATNFNIWTSSIVAGTAEQVVTQGGINVSSGIVISLPPNILTTTSTITSSMSVVESSCTDVGTTNRWITMTLPPAASVPGQDFMFYDVANDSCSIRISGTGTDLIESTGTIYLNAMGQHASLHSLGAAGWASGTGGIQLTPFALQTTPTESGDVTIGVSSEVVQCPIYVPVPVTVMGFRAIKSNGSGKVSFGIFDQNGKYEYGVSTQATNGALTTYTDGTVYSLSPGWHKAAISTNNTGISFSGSNSLTDGSTSLCGVGATPTNLDLSKVTLTNTGTRNIPQIHFDIIVNGGQQAN